MRAQPICFPTQLYIFHCVFEPADRLPLGVKQSWCNSVWQMFAYCNQHKPDMCDRSDVKQALQFAGSQLDLPHSVTVSHLVTLLNTLLGNDERLPYSFFVHDVELAEDLGTHMLENHVRRIRRCPSNLLMLYPCIIAQSMFCVSNASSSCNLCCLKSFTTD